jgi:cysteine synthase
MNLIMAKESGSKEYLVTLNKIIQKKCGLCAKLEGHNRVQISNKDRLALEAMPHGIGTGRIDESTTIVDGHCRPD